MVVFDLPPLCDQIDSSTNIQLYDLISKRTRRECECVVVLLPWRRSSGRTGILVTSTAQRGPHLIRIPSAGFVLCTLQYVVVAAASVSSASLLRREVSVE